MARKDAKHKLVWLAILLLSVSVVAVYWLARVPQVEVVQPHRGLAVRAVYATGTVEPTVNIPIAPRAAGRIVQLLADEGDRVTEGEILARLEDADLRRSVEELQARERYAFQVYERTSALVSRGVAAAIELDRARAELDAARAATARAEEQLAYMMLRAPADGYLLRRDGEVGEYLAVNQPLFFMSTDAPLRIQAEVDEEDIPLVAASQAVLIRADAFPGQVFEGRVAEITPKGDPLTRSYRVRISLPERSGLHVGMTADTNIVVDRRENALLVPSTAVVDGRAWVVEDSQLQPRRVTPGIEGEEELEIVSGLKEDDWLVERPQADFRPGQRVKAVATASSS